MLLFKPSRNARAVIATPPPLPFSVFPRVQADVVTGRHTDPSRAPGAGFPPPSPAYPTATVASLHPPPAAFPTAGSRFVALDAAALAALDVLRAEGAAPSEGTRGSLLHFLDRTRTAGGLGDTMAAMQLSSALLALICVLNELRHRQASLPAVGLPPAPPVARD